MKSTGTTQVMRKIKVTLIFIKDIKFLIKLIINKKKKPGEIFGWLSFMTDGLRMSSIQSKDFSTVYEIKKADFLKIIQLNSKDYVINKFLYLGF